MTDQFINRSALTENFTVLPNALLNDDRVSGEGLALMVYLLSKPPSWQLSPTDIRKRFKWGRDKAYRVIADLIECGYIVKDAEREGGRFNVHVYFIYDTPQISPFPEKPDTEKPDPVNQDTIKNRETNHISIIERTKSNKGTSGSTNSGSWSLTSRPSHSAGQSSCGHVRAPIRRQSLMLTRRSFKAIEAKGRASSISAAR